MTGRTTGAEEPLRADGAAHCVAHRLRYDPQLNVGCVLCQRAFATAPAIDRSPQLFAPIALGVLAGMLAAVALELSPWLQPTEPASRAAERRIAWQGLGAPVPLVPPVPAVPPVPPAERQDRQPAPQSGSFDNRLPAPIRAPSAGLAGAAVRGDVRAIERQLAAGATIDALDSEGLTPLLWAVLARRVDAARTLIERGAQLEIRMREGRTPLMLAAQHGLESVSALLIERGAKLDSVDSEGQSALMLAARADHPGVVSSLLAGRATVALRSNRDYDALMQAALADASAATIDALIDGGAVIDARAKDDMTALLLAASWGRARSVGALIARGARLDARDSRGWSALDHVVSSHPNEDEQRFRGREATFDLLIASGIDPRLALDPALNRLDFRAKLEAIYARHGLGSLAPYRLGPAAPAPPTSARPPSPPSALLDSPATVKLLARASGGEQESAPIASGALVGYRGWTSVPQVIARAVVREVALYGEQRATLVGDARGEGEWSVADVLLLELMENGRLVDIAFAGSAQGLEVNGKPVRRLGATGYDHIPGEVDLTAWLTPSGRELVVSALSSFRGGSVSEVFLRINGAGARRVVSRAEVDHSGTGGTL